jgi:FHS family L-fucose permease-like MFS transporter
LGAAAVPLSLEVIGRMNREQLHAYRLQQAASVKAPYLGLAMALAALAVMVAIFKLPVIQYAEAHATSKASVWRHPRLVLGAIAVFLYVGAEVAIGSLMTNYFNQKVIGNLPLQRAAVYLQYYWGGAMLGRFAGAALLRRLRTPRLLAIAAAIAAVLVAISVFTLGNVAMWSLILVGLFNSIMFPSIFAMAIEGLGPLTGRGSGLLVAAIIGGAVIPEFEGLLADHIGIHYSFVLPLLCYFYIVFYAVWIAGKSNPLSLESPGANSFGCRESSR